MATTNLLTTVQRIRRLASTANDCAQSDGELLGEFLADKNPSAFETIIRRHGMMVSQICRRELGNAHDAEDAFQATFLILAQQASSIRKRDSLSSWLHGVAFRMATNAKRAAKRRRKHESNFGSSRETADPAGCVAWKEIQSILDEEIQALPDSYREPFIRCCLEQASCAEAAKQLGLAETVVRNRLSGARKRLQNKLARRGVSLSAVLAAMAVSAAPEAIASSFVGATANAAAHLAGGQGSPCDLVSPKVIILMEGVKRSMFLVKSKIAGAVAILCAAVGIGFGIASAQTSGATTGQSLPGKDASEEQQGARRADKPKARADAPPVQQPKPEATGEVLGRVLDPDHKPVEGAKIYLWKSPVPGRWDRQPGGPESLVRPQEVTKTGPDGRFRLDISKVEVEASDNESPGFQVMAVKDGFGCDWQKTGEGKEEITLRLVKDQPITVRILDADGKPVQGAKLAVEYLLGAKNDDLTDYIASFGKNKGYTDWLKDWTGAVPEMPKVLTTGADGRLKLTGIGRNRVVHLHVEGPAIASTSFDVMARDAETIVSEKGGRLYGASSEFVCQASRPIRGVVRDLTTGKPMQGVTVTGQYDCEALTDKDGRYELLGLRKSTSYEMKFMPADGLHFQRRVGIKDTPGLTPLVTADVGLLQGLTVLGKVTDKATGKPIAGARIDYHPLSGNKYVNYKIPDVWWPCSEATTAADGSYKITVLPGPGVMGVTAPRRQAYMAAAVPVKDRKDFFKAVVVDNDQEDYFVNEVGGQAVGAIAIWNYNSMILLEPDEKQESLVRDVSLELPLERKGRVIGPDGKPISGATVLGLTPTLDIVTLKGSDFVVKGINPRAKRPLAFTYKDKTLGHLGFFIKELQGDPTELLTVKLEPCGSVSGRVLDAEGEPVPGLDLHLMTMAFRRSGEDHTATTDKDGRFRAEGIVPGQEYGIRAPQQPRLYVKVLIESAKPVDLGDIKMKR